MHSTGKSTAPRAAMLQIYFTSDLGTMHANSTSRHQEVRVKIGIHPNEDLFNMTTVRSLVRFPLNRAEECFGFKRVSRIFISMGKVSYYRPSTRNMSGPQHAQRKRVAVKLKIDFQSRAAAADILFLAPI